MIPKTLDEINAADIQYLIGSGIREGRTLDYKQELPGEAGDEKREFLADVSSFANTSGGDIVFGMREEEGVAAEILGIAGTDLDAAILRMDSIIATGIQPRVRHRIHLVRTALADPVAIIRIEKSSIGPHRVVFRSHDKFYARNSAGKYPLDLTELRDAFLRTSSVSEGIRNFRLERIASIRSGETPVEAPVTPRLVIHLIPIGAFGGEVDFDMRNFYRNPHQVQPMLTQSWNHRPNLDGLVAYSSVPASVNGSMNYTQLYRSGIVEAVDGAIAQRHTNGPMVIALQRIEQTVLRYVPQYFAHQAALGVSPPVYIFLSLLDAKGSYPYIGNDFGIDLDRYSPLDRDRVLLPETAVLDFDSNMASALRPVFNMLWNSFGFAASTSYSGSGDYCQARQLI
jgi:hypothetical protein